MGIEGSTEVTVTGRNFVVGAKAQCRLEISPLTGCDFPIQSDGREDRKNGSDPGHYPHSWDVSSLQRLRIPSATNYTAPATVINATHLSCTPPAVATDGVRISDCAQSNLHTNLKRGPPGGFAERVYGRSAVE